MGKKSVNDKILNLNWKPEKREKMGLKETVKWISI